MWSMAVKGVIRYALDLQSHRLKDSMNLSLVNPLWIVDEVQRVIGVATLCRSRQQHRRLHNEQLGVPAAGALDDLPRPVERLDLVRDDAPAVLSRDNQQTPPNVLGASVLTSFVHLAREVGGQPPVTAADSLLERRDAEHHLVSVWRTHSHR